VRQGVEDQLVGDRVREQQSVVDDTSGPHRLHHLRVDARERADRRLGEHPSSVREPIDEKDVAVGNGALVAALVTREPRRICNAMGEQEPAVHRLLASCVPRTLAASPITSAACLATSGQNLAIHTRHQAARTVADDADLAARDRVGVPGGVHGVLDGDGEVTERPVGKGDGADADKSRRRSRNV
jgi:hypothetical protein